MKHVTASAPDEQDRPLLRHPPPPPGYVDPLGASQVLHELAELDDVTVLPSAPPGSAGRSRRRTP